MGLKDDNLNLGLPKKDALALDYLVRLKISPGEGWIPFRGRL